MKLSKEQVIQIILLILVVFGVIYFTYFMLENQLLILMCINLHQIKH